LIFGARKKFFKLLKYSAPYVPAAYFSVAASLRSAAMTEPSFRSLSSLLPNSVYMIGNYWNIPDLSAQADFVITSAKNLLHYD
jgi:hypothetical protein